MRSSPKTLAVLLVAALALVLGACDDGEPEDPSAGVEVAGDVGRRPVIRFEAPLDIGEVVTREIVAGDGNPLVEGNAVMLSYLAVDAITGEVTDENYGGEPRILLLTEDETGPLYDDLVGRTEGTRLLRLEPGSMTRPDPVLIVYDILYTEAHGTELETAADLPQVERGEDGTPAVTLPDGDPPTSLTIVPLIRGEGPQVQSGESVTVRYVQVQWSEQEILDSTWGPGSRPITIPLVDRIPGLQDGLVDATVGSQVMLVIPPDQADGTDTWVFVVDVLAVTTLSDSESPGAG